MRAARAAKVVMLDKDNNALVLRRSPTHPTQAGEDDLPGGIVERGETLEAGLIREVFEETGLRLSELQLNSIYVLNRGRIFKRLRILYAVRLDQQPDIRLSDEHDKFRWQPIDTVSTIELPYQIGVDRANQQSMWSAI